MDYKEKRSEFNNCEMYSLECSTFWQPLFYLDENDQFKNNNQSPLSIAQSVRPALI